MEVAAENEIKAGWIVSKPGVEETMTVVEVRSLTIALRTKDGVVEEHLRADLEEYGWIATPPAGVLTHAPATDTAKDTPELPVATTDATGSTGSADAGVATQAEGEQANPAPSATTDATGGGNGAPPSPPADDAVSALKLEMDAEMARIQEKYQKKMLEAMKKAKPLGQRRQEALDTMDKLRDLVRAARGDVMMTDEDADAIIIQAIAETDGAVIG